MEKQLPKSWPIKRPKKYIVYKNDLHYKKHRDIDPNKAVWDDEQTETMFNNIDFDTLEYRITDCKNNNYYSLDLKNLDLKIFPHIPSHVKSKVKHLFIGDNILEIIPDLSDYMCLETLDICHNNITNINNLPSNLIELSCSHNKLKSLPLLKNIKRLDCAHNELTSIPQYQNIEVLNCSFNKLTELPLSNTLKKLIADNNEITKINKYDTLEYLHISNNMLSHLPDLNLLCDFICSNNKFPIKLSELRNIKSFEFFNTKIVSLNYYPTLLEIYCSKDTLGTISTRYIVDNLKVHKEKFYIITFKHST